MPSAYASNTTIAGVARRVEAARRIAIVTHARPDGDALGSVLALARALPALGKTVDPFVMGPIEPPLLVVAGSTPIRRVENDPPGDDHDLVLVVDTGAWGQLEPLAAWLRQRRDRVVVIDHHPQGDPDVADERVVDPDAPAAAELVLGLLGELKVELTGEREGVAEALFVGIATDTGWFRYANAGMRAHAAAARLLAAGVEKSRLYRVIEETHRPERLALESRALASVEFVCDGTVAIQSLVASDFDELGCTVEDLTGVVNLPMVVGRVRASILLAEVAPGQTKVSFRSKPPVDDEPLIDVNELAGRFGGGGHVFASGARVAKPLREARQDVRAALAAPVR
jgi:phosphoesterase RecJ-like protein